LIAFLPTLLARRLLPAALALLLAGSNILVAGQFTGSADFDPSAGTAKLSSAGSTDAFVAKFNSGGNYTWARRIGGSKADRATVVTADSSGNIYATGQFAGTADFDPGSGAANLSTSISDVFALKLTAGGNYAWARAPVGGNGNNVGEGIGISGSSLYIAGAFGGTLDFDPGPGTTSRTAGGTSDIFVWKLINL